MKSRGERQQTMAKFRVGDAVIIQDVDSLADAFKGRQGTVVYVVPDKYESDFPYVVHIGKNEEYGFDENELELTKE